MIGPRHCLHGLHEAGPAACILRLAPVRLASSRPDASADNHTPGTGVPGATGR